MKKICMLGLGYIGLPTAATLAVNGVEVVGYDKSERVVKTLASGSLHIEEEGLDSHFKNALADGMLTVSSDLPSDADIEAYMVCVPTPAKKEGDVKVADLKYVESAAADLGPVLRKGQLVILESTVPPGTTMGVFKDILEEKSGLKAGPDFYLAHCPERVIPGKILEELVNNARVIGGIDSISAEKAGELYRAFVKGEIFLTDCTTAETAKLMENTFRDIQIALANEFAKFSEGLGIDVWEVIELANKHPRVKILWPGPGVGGHCIPVDPWFLIEKGGGKANVTLAARRVNDGMPAYVMDTIKTLLPQGGKVAVWGLSYKGDVDDFRESPSMELIELFRKEGISYSVHDPHVDTSICPERVVSLMDSADGADLIAVLVDHSEFKGLSSDDITALASKVSSKMVLDTRNVLDEVKWRTAGFETVKLGRGRGGGGQ